MVPDLHHVREDAPGSRGGRPTGASAALGSTLRRLCPAWLHRPVQGVHASAARVGRRFSVALLAVSVASALSVGLLAPAASADSLGEQKARVTQQLARTRSQLTESSQALSSAGAALEQAQGQLDVARGQLAQTRLDLAAARERDATMAKKLVASERALAAAKAAVVAGQKALDRQKAMAATMVRDQYQQQTNLMPIAVLLQNSSTGDLQTRLQWSTTMFDTTSTTISQLTVLQDQLTAKKARQAELTAEVADDRAAAAKNLDLKKTLQAQAETQAASVAQLVTTQASVQAAAAAAVARDKDQYAKLSQERAVVTRRIAVRVAQAKAAAARQAAHERAQSRAREAAAKRAAAHAAAVARRASHEAKKPVERRPVVRRPVVRRPVVRHADRPEPRHVVRSSRPSRSSSSSSGAHHGFSYPVSAPITSPYGMRLHPVTHIWKLHDGTDFGAGCGTAIYAAYSGRVAESYYNAGYGNRLMIDHGMVDGRYVTTGYNHAIRYVVSVGQHVRQGQLIGYVGTTGYSTGCHLHLMVWLDGSVVNPMTWY